MSVTRLPHRLAAHCPVNHIEAALHRATSAMSHPPVLGLPLSSRASFGMCVVNR